MRVLLGREAVTMGAIALVVALGPLILNGYYVYLLSIVFAYVILAAGFNVVLGWSGQLAFMSAAFFGFGAWVSGRATTLYGVPAEIALVLGTVGAAILGLAFGALAVRLARYYLAIVTLALMYLLDYSYRNFADLMGGVSGFRVPIPQFALLGGARAVSDSDRYYVGLILASLAYLVVRWLRTTSMARGWRVIKRDERVAAALGLNVYLSRLSAFVVASAFLGLAGAWFVFLNTRFLPDAFGMQELLFDFLILVVGGLGSLNGAVVGAALLVIAREYLRTFPGLSEVLFGGILLAVALFLPAGLYGTVAARFRSMREGVT